jgi:hypothetical protein
MDLFTDRMAGPMDKEVAIPDLTNHVAANVIDFSSKWKPT